MFALIALTLCLLSTMRRKKAKPKTSLERAYAMLAGPPARFDLKGRIVSKGTAPRVRDAIDEFDQIRKQHAGSPAAAQAERALGTVLRHGHYDLLEKEAVEIARRLNREFALRFPEPPPPRTAVVVAGDPQNVHDPTVVRAMKSSWAKVGSTSGNTDLAILELKNEMHRRLQNDKLKHALMTVERIATANEYIVFADAHEKDILASTWEKVQTTVDPELKESLLELLAGRMADGVENGLVVCAQGRASRALDVFSGVDPENSVLPAHALREELLTKAVAIRKKIVDKMSETELEKAETDGELARKLQKELVETARADYVEAGVLSETELQQELSQWIDSVE